VSARVVLLFPFYILISFTTPVQILKQKIKTYGYKYLYTKDSKWIMYSSLVTTALRLVHKADMVNRPKAAKSLHSTVTGKCKACTEISRKGTGKHKHTE
jgi:hypothetical protein